MTIQQFKSQAIKSLENGKIPSPSAALDVSILLEHCLKQNKTWILLHSSEELNTEQFAWLTEAVAARSTGLPVAYITGHKEFYGLDFIVSPAVLIPKPDTEILVKNAIDRIKDKMYAHPESILMVCDMCTGSGCIGLSVLRSLLDDSDLDRSMIPQFTLVDISPDALEIARINAKRLFSEDEQERIRFVQSNLFDDVPWDFDAVLTNPPYIPAAMVDELLKDGRREPRLALDGDVNVFGMDFDSSDGLELIRGLIPQAYERLVYNGIFLMETGEYNAEEACALSKKAGFRNTKIICDLEGQLRDVYGVK